ncbi:hypothetical protein ACFP1Z_12890 [Streptomyces gamaensis]|uniref:Lipoprotein n=1 Tax=Streptomyces gamaensis TaxID=1763542 RepID=A0ABW0Z3T0_9ACTN
MKGSALIPGAALGLSAAGLLLAGCGAPGALHHAGATPTAQAPTGLWPDLPPPPAQDYGPAQPEAVNGVVVPDGDLHKVNPVDIVKAQIKAHPDTVTGADAPDNKAQTKATDEGALDKGTADAIGKCTEPAVGYEQLAACRLRRLRR